LKYIGSVRFFKNLILLAVIIAIAVPSGFAIKQKSELNKLDTQLAQATEQIAALEEKINSIPQLISEPPSYQALYPDFYAPQALSANHEKEGVIYLTFDDGPSARTGEILEILREEDVKATFFVIGPDTERSREYLRQIADEGHTIGMHSYTHKYKTIYSSVEAYLDDMYQIFTEIKDATGITPSVFRFPGGSINSYNYELNQELINEMIRRGFVPYDWNISSGDASGYRVDTQTITTNILNYANVERGIILMHDSAAKTTTVEALRPVIHGLREKGYTFEALSADVKPILF